MNYISFLNKSNKSRYRLYTKKKNSKKILFSASAGLLLVSGFMVFAMKATQPDTSPQISENNQPAKTTLALTLIQTDRMALKNTNTPISSAELAKSDKQSKLLLPADLQSANQHIPLTVSTNDETKPLEAENIISKSLATKDLATKTLVTKQLISPISNDDFSTFHSSQAITTELPASETITRSLNRERAPSSLHATNITLTKAKTITIKKGDTLSKIFKRLSLSSKTLHKIMKSGSDAQRLSRIRPGKEITFSLDNDNQLVAISYPIDKIDTLQINKKADSFIIQIDSKEVEIQQQFATASINASLFTAGSQAGLSNSMIMKLAQLFGWDIDFALDIRKGDTFSLIYEDKFINGKKISEGDILAAEFINQGKTFYAVRYTDPSGKAGYYSDNGYSMRKAFLRTPVEFSRISSRFSSGRKHPVLNRIRAHKGVDYAASRGTPVKAAGKGKVIFKGTKGGYGRVIILQHGSKYTTLYAHLNSYGKKIKKGSRVKQGQIIGYVGSSGLATGPHLHYEFRVNGTHRNPLTVPLPNAAPLAKKYRPEYDILAENMISQIKSRKQSTIALTSE